MFYADGGKIEKECVMICSTFKEDDVKEILTARVQRLLIGELLENLSSTSQTIAGLSGGDVQNELLDLHLTHRVLLTVGLKHRYRRVN